MYLGPKALLGCMYTGLQAPKHNKKFLSRTRRQHRPHFQLIAQLNFSIQILICIFYICICIGGHHFPIGQGVNRKEDSTHLTCRVFLHPQNAIFAFQCIINQIVSTFSVFFLQKLLTKLNFPLRLTGQFRMPCFKCNFFLRFLLILIMSNVSHVFSFFSGINFFFTGDKFKHECIFSLPTS